MNIKKTNKQLTAENQDLRLRLDEAEETLLAIRNGEVDALIIAGVNGEQVFTLKQAEEQIRYQAVMLESVNDAIVAYDAEYRLTVWNPAAESLYGWKANEVLGLNGVELLTTQWPHMGSDTMRHNIADMGSWRGEATQRHKDGSRIPVEMSVLVFRDESKAITGYISVNHNITERKRAEETLRESEKRFRALVENNSAAISMLNAEGIAIYDSPAAPGMLGYTTEDWIGKDVFALVHPDDLFRIWTIFQELIKTPGAQVSNIFRVHHQNGSWLWIEMVTTNLLAEPGVNAVVLNYRDITERKQAEQALFESERHYRQIVETAGEGVWVINAHNSTTLANKRLSEMLGYGIEEIMGKSVFDFIDEDEQVSAAIGLDRRQRGIKEQLDFKFKRKDGNSLWALMETSSLQDQEGKYTGALAMLTDITQRKQTEMEIRGRLSELEVLYQSGLAFSQLIDQKRISKKIIYLLDRKMDWHHTAIRLYHAETETLELLAFNLPNLKSREERRGAQERFNAVKHLSDGLSGWVVQHGQVVRSNDLKNDPRYLETFPGLQSGLYVPIKIAKRVIGVISIESQRAHDFSESDERLVITLAAQAAIAMDNAQLFKSLKHSNIDLALAYNATIEGWSRALDLRDKETEGHSLRVTEMTMKLARVFGLSEAELVQIRWGALLHDIGKMGIPDGILLKPGPLTEEEWVVMKKHPTFAYEMLHPILYLRGALDIPYCHHEKWDGSGYPRGVKGEQIPLAARLFAVVDVWDALKSNRPYRVGWTEEKVSAHIRFSAGTHFDPQVVDIFLKMTSQAGVL